MKIVLLLIAVLISGSAFAQKGKIHGVITYFFNTTQGDKPDLGALVYVVDSSRCPNYSNEIAFQFELASIKGDRGDTAFKNIDLKNALNNNQIKRSDYVNTTTVDGAGNYTLELPTGIYYILIQSKGRNSTSLSEIIGKVYTRKIKINPDQTVDISYNFTLN